MSSTSDLPLAVFAQVRDGLNDVGAQETELFVPLRSEDDADAVCAALGGVLCVEVEQRGALRRGEDVRVLLQLSDGLPIRFLGHVRGIVRVGATLRADVSLYDFMAEDAVYLMASMRHSNRGEYGRRCEMLPALTETTSLNSIIEATAAETQHAGARPITISFDSPELADCAKFVDQDFITDTLAEDRSIPSLVSAVRAQPISDGRIQLPLRAQTSRPVMHPQAMRILSRQSTLRRNRNSNRSHTARLATAGASSALLHGESAGSPSSTAWYALFVIVALLAALAGMYGTV